MTVWRCVVFGFLVAASLGGQSASAEPIGMPADAKAWMKFEAGACPDADGDDCLGSTLIGPNPPNGIPMSTFGSGDSFGTGFAEILPGRIRSFARGQSVFMHSSFEDTYTVRGTAAEPFNIPVEFHATGVARSQGRACPSPICNQLVGANGEIKIGTFNVLPSGQFSEGLRVSEFGPQARTNFSFPTEGSGTPFTRPIDVTATHTVPGVNVGDSFVLAFGMNSRHSVGEIDLSNGGVASFTLPPGVLLSSARAESLLPEFIYLVGNVGVTDLTGISVVAGDLIISENSNVTTVNLSELTSVGGNLEITENPSAGSLDLGSLQSVTGNVDVSNNASTGSLDLSELQTVTGNLTITDNGNATVNVSSLVSVTGDLTLETTGAGTLHLEDTNVSGNLDLEIEGYTTVEGATGGGTTEVTMVNNSATMEVRLPDGAFTSETPVSFSVSTVPGGVEVVDGQSITHLARYAFDFAIPTLNSVAELNFEINLTAMDEPARLALIDVLHDDAVLTIGVLGDAPDAELQLFDVCAPGTDPILDDCVTVRWLDATGAELDPTAGIDPDVLRFDSLVGHFSTYSVVGVSSSFVPGDIDQDGDVDRMDAAIFSQFFGREAGSTWATGDFNGDAATTLVDLALLQSHLGQPAASPTASSAAVPEPAAELLLISILAPIALIVLARTRRRALPVASGVRTQPGLLTRRSLGQ